MRNDINGLSLECFRLRLARRKKRAQRLDFDKKLLAIDREERAISKQINLLGYEPLDPPVQRGYKRYFVLREDVARSKDCKLFQGILDKINTTQYSWKKDFKEKRRRGGKKIYVVREQKLEQIWAWSIHKKRFSEEEMLYFDWVITGHKIGKEFAWVYQFREPWRFTLKIEPNIIRRKRKKDFDLERREREIADYIDRNHLRSRMLKLRHGWYAWRSAYHYLQELPKYKYHPFRNRSFTDILSEHFPENRFHVIQRKPSEPRVSFLLLIVLKAEREGSKR